MFESQLKKSLLLLQVKSKTRLKSCILGLNFEPWPKPGKSRYIAFCNIISIKGGESSSQFRWFTIAKIEL